MRDLRIATPTGTHVSMHIAQLTDGTALVTLHDCGKPHHGYRRGGTSRDDAEQLTLPCSSNANHQMIGGRDRGSWRKHGWTIHNAALLLDICEANDEAWAA